MGETKGKGEEEIKAREGKGASIESDGTSGSVSGRGGLQNVLDLRLSYVSTKALHGSIGKQWYEWMPLRRMKRLDKRPRPCVSLAKKKKKVESHGRASKKVVLQGLSRLGNSQQGRS